MNRRLRILVFSSDHNLLLPEHPWNESQFRQRRYCELLDQRRSFIVLGGDCPHHRQALAEGRIFSARAPGRNLAMQLIGALWMGARQCLTFKPDLIEYQDPLITGLPAYLLAVGFGVPLAGGIFNDFVSDPAWPGASLRRRLMRRAGRYVLRRTRLARCDSRQTAEALQALGFVQVTYIPFVIPWLDEFRPRGADLRTRLETWEREPVVLCVARLSAEKNLALLLRAFARVSPSVKRARLHIVGGGPQERELKALADELDISDKIKWFGPVEYRHLPPLFQAANIFVLSSDSETSARVLTLAQVAGLPTLTTETSGSASVVQNEITGYIVPVGNEAALADRLRRLLQDRLNYQRLLEADYSAAASDHDERVITGHLRQFYKEVCAA